MEHIRYNKVRNIDTVVFGKYEIATWYYSPFPDEYKDIKKIYVCQHCMKYMKVKETYGRHISICEWKYPPGEKIYEVGRNKIYEVDGKLHKLYCQNFCLLAKFFLDNKMIYYDVESFLFYILTEVDDRNEEHVIGYFSKEKISYDNYNLACILVFPPYQRRGYGLLLIDFSYELSKREHKIGSPERPISDLGIRGYHSYWKRTILKILQNYTTNLYSIQEGTSTINGDGMPHNDNGRFMITINEISLMTSIRREDIIFTLQEMGFLKYRKPNANSVNYTALTYDVNNHVVNGNEQHEDHQQPHNNSPQQTQYQSHRDEEFAQQKHQQHIICITRRMVDDYIRSHGVRLDNRTVDICGLKWTKTSIPSKN
ncbi:acyl-CoA N-acyltransferase [Gigaspora rosea]|uniref:histone acetyltransferase n=1 Tax=Gigaspora rosea TaxID=44941 RepID=A0A397TZ33_9GLOM|nr:acyl-CoA N-acyltransferase [Gigaspora rosea]